MKYNDAVYAVARDVAEGEADRMTLIYEMWKMIDFDLSVCSFEENFAEYSEVIKPLMYGTSSIQGIDRWQANHIDFARKILRKVEMHYCEEADALVEAAIEQLVYEREYELKINNGRPIEYDGEEDYNRGSLL